VAGFEVLNDSVGAAERKTGSLALNSVAETLSLPLAAKSTGL